MSAVSTQPVVSISEFRSNLAAFLKALASDESGIRILGSHRKPQAVVMSVDSFSSLSSSQAITLAEVIRKRDTLLRIARSYGIEKVGVFGSVARGDQHSKSDLDVAIESQGAISTLEMTSFALDAEHLFDCKFDVVSLRGLRADRHQEILQDLVML